MANIALISYHPKFNNVPYNQNRLESLTNKAVAEGAKIVVFGEGAIDGYVQLADGEDWTYWSDHLQKWCKDNHSDSEIQKCRDVDNVAQGPDNRDVINFWEDYARKFEVTIILQMPEKDGENYYNTAFIIGPEGITAKHRKKHLVITDTGYATAGKKATVANLPFGEVGILICADGHSPDLFLEYASRKVKKFIGLGYGITPAKYQKHATATNLKGLIVDSNQYLGVIEPGQRKIMALRSKEGYVLYDYDFNYIKKVLVNDAH